MSFAIPFHDVYRHLVTWLMSDACPEQTNERTGRKVKVGRGGTSFRVDLHGGVLPTCGLRKTFPKSAAAEVAWFLSGEQDVTWLAKYAPFWNKFTEADGKTIAAAYGYRWTYHFNRDQIGRAIEALRDDPSDRRVYIGTWDPSLDGLGEEGQKNVPCPVGFTLSVLDGELHSTLTLRSSDVVVGLPYDVMGHALLMDAVAASLSVDVGVMQVALAHAHIYEDHYEIAAEMLAQSPVVPFIHMPYLSIEGVQGQRDAYVQHVADLCLKYDWPSYNPKPFVVE